MKVGIIILSGGKGRRVGGKDKGWCLYQNKPFIEIVLRKLQQQSVQISQHEFHFFISANRNLTAYQQLSVEVIPDQRENYCGPLSGIESVIKNNNESQIERWLSYPVDSIDVPNNYLAKILLLSEMKAGYAAQVQQSHYAHLSILESQAGSLFNYLNSGQRSIKGWLKEIDADPIYFDESVSFKNLNREKPLHKTNHD